MQIWYLGLDGKQSSRKVEVGGPDKLGEVPLLSPSPPLAALVLGSPGRTYREKVDKGVSVEGVGPWATSIYDGSFPFYERVVCLSGGEGTVGGAALFDS